MKIATHLAHIRHCQTVSGISWSNRWTYRAFSLNTCPECIVLNRKRVFSVHKILLSRRCVWTMHLLVWRAWRVRTRYRPKTRPDRVPGKECMIYSWSIETGGIKGWARARAVSSANQRNVFDLQRPSSTWRYELRVPRVAKIFKIVHC